jgi:hypothetical protein
MNMCTRRTASTDFRHCLIRAFREHNRQRSSSSSRLPRSAGVRSRYQVCTVTRYPLTSSDIVTSRSSDPKHRVSCVFTSIPSHEVQYDRKMEGLARRILLCVLLPLLLGSQECALAFVRDGLLGRDSPRVLRVLSSSSASDPARGLPARSRCALHLASADDSYSREERRSTKLTINLLSFDGGGVMGALSTRMLAYTLQYVLSGQQQQQPQGEGAVDEDEEGVAGALDQAAKDGKGLGKSWRRRLFKYVDAFEATYDVLWTSFAQKLDSARISPQEEGMTRWMDYDWTNPMHADTMRSIVRIDLAYEFYLAHVLYVLYMELLTVRMHATCVLSTLEHSPPMTLLETPFLERSRGRPREGSFPHPPCYACR